MDFCHYKHAAKNTLTEFPYRMPEKEIIYLKEI